MSSTETSEFLENSDVSGYLFSKLKIYWIIGAIISQAIAL
jgi:hypothetical protein